MDSLDFLKSFNEKLQSHKSSLDSKDLVTVRSLPASPKVKKLYAELLSYMPEIKKVLDEARDLLSRANAVREIVWSTIELELNQFDKNLRYNEKTNEIEILEERKKDNKN